MQKPSPNINFQIEHKWLNGRKLCPWQPTYVDGISRVTENGYESKLIDRISETILFNLHDGCLHVGKNHEDVDLYDKILHTFIDNMKLMEHVESNKVRMIGICGLGGIGKTTLARADYNLMSIYFEVCCFVADVEGVTKRLGLCQVQRQLISNIEKTTDVNLEDVHQGIMMLKQKIAHRRVLLVIDGVEKREQLEALAGSRDWFSAGSLIIVTSKSENLLCDHMVDSIYKMTPLRNQSEHQIRQLREEVQELRTFCQEVREEIGNIHQMVSEQSKMMRQMMANFQHFTLLSS